MVLLVQPLIGNYTKSNIFLVKSKDGFVSRNCLLCRKLRYERYNNKHNKISNKKL